MTIYIPQFPDSSVLIVGGTSGIGLATARAFAAVGTPRIALVGRNHGRGESAREAVRAANANSNVCFISADVTTAIGAEHAVKSTIDLFGTIDILVNSTVGTGLPSLFHKLPMDRILDDLTNQAIGPILTCRAAIGPMQQKGGGVIINIASDAAKVPTPGETVIGSAMAAITMFSKTLAMEAKRNGIRVNVITPSLVARTGTYDRLYQDQFSAKLFDKAVNLAALGITHPEDIADLCVFLASPSAAKITGQAISVNGGISAV